MCLATVPDLDCELLNSKPLHDCSSERSMDLMCSFCAIICSLSCEMCELVRVKVDDESDEVIYFNRFLNIKIIKTMILYNCGSA